MLNRQALSAALCAVCFASAARAQMMCPTTLTPGPAPGTFLTPLPDGTLGQPYSLTFTASGGTAPYTFSTATWAPLPQGFSLSSDGVLSGTPQWQGTSNPFWIFATDATGCPAGFGYTLTARLPACPAILPAEIPSSATVGVAYPTTTFSLAGGGSYVFSGAGVPPGMSFAPSGDITPLGGLLGGPPLLYSTSATLSGTPSAPDFYSIKIDATGAGGCRREQIYPLRSCGGRAPFRFDQPVYLYNPRLPSGLAAIALADFDGDGQTDVVVTDESAFWALRNSYADGAGLDQVLFGVGDPLCPNSCTGPGLPPGQHAVYAISSIVVADFDGDGALDLAVAFPELSSVAIFFRRGPSDYQLGPVFDAGGIRSRNSIGMPPPVTLTAVDLNGDGIPDLAVANGSGYVRNDRGLYLPVPGSLAAFINDGHGGFTQTASVIANAQDSIVVADFDGDGIPDMVAGAWLPASTVPTPTILFSRGLGGGAFAPAEALPASAQGESTMVTSGDFDGDGRPDVAAVVRGLPFVEDVSDGTAGSVVLFVSRPGGLVKSSEVPLQFNHDWGADTGWGSQGGIGAADFDGDFAVDVAVSQGGAVQIVPGDGAGGLGPPQIPMAGSVFPGAMGRVLTGSFTAPSHTDLIIGGLLLPNISPYCCEVRLSQPSVDKDSLWPPTGEMVPVTVTYAAKSNCSNDVSCSVSVSGGDASVIDAHHVLLRAQRDGDGSGRTYTLTVSCADGDGGTSTGTATVAVPHDRRR